jgi:hypothetical protein
VRDGQLLPIRNRGADRGVMSRIWLYMPYFGVLPSYFQLYLDSLARNADTLSIFLLTDIDLSEYRIPDNLIRIATTLDCLRERFVRLLDEEFQLDIPSSRLVQRPKKLCDFRVFYPSVFHELGKHHGVREDDLVGWGDCDVIYGRFVEFLADHDYQVIGTSGHFTVGRNVVEFRTLYRRIVDLPHLLLTDANNHVDELAFRSSLLEFAGRKLFYPPISDICPEEFFGLFRGDFDNTFFNIGSPDRRIDRLHYDRDGRLTVIYRDGGVYPCLYCHLQKRPMKVEFDDAPNGYYIRESTFALQ